jgi:hypothetical protein
VVLVKQHHRSILFFILIFHHPQLCEVVGFLAVAVVAGFCQQQPCHFLAYLT